MRYALVLDSGTTSVRGALVDTNGKLVDFSQQELNLYQTDNNGIHQDPYEILNKSKEVLLDVLHKNNLKNEDIIGLGITNQRETTILFDCLGNPLADAIVWQSKESESVCQNWIRKGYNDLVKDNTGLTIDAYFSASKIRYLLEANPDLTISIKNNHCLFGTVDTWLIYHFTHFKQHVTDASNASRTMLFNIHINDWDTQLCQLFNIPMNILPTVKDSIDDFGMAFLGEYTIPIVAVLGDQQAACIGDGCLNYGDTKVTYGTGGFVLVNTANKAIESKNGMVTSIGYRLNNQITYVLEGSVFIAGAAIQWLRDELGIIASAKESEQLASQVNDSNGVVVIPSFTGLGAPYWNGKAKAMICGLSRKSNRCHIAYATLQAIANSIEDVLVAMRNDLNHPLNALVVDGGASANNVLTQMQANLSNATVTRYTCVESTLLGVAYFVLYACKVIDNLAQVIALKKVDQQFLSDHNQQTRNKTRKIWKKGIDCVNLFSQE